MKSAWLKVAGLAAVLVAAPAWGQETEGGLNDPKCREAVRAAFEEARAGLAESPIDAETPVAVLPIAKDLDGWLLGQANDALVGAGKTCVVGKDDEPMWKTVIAEIAWDDIKGGMLDPATLDRLDARKLKSAKVLMDVKVVTWRPEKGRAWKAEVTFRAVEIATKQWLWCGFFDNRPKSASSNSGPLWQEVACPLNVAVIAEASEGPESLAEQVGSWARGRLADLGYRPESGKAEDVTLRLTTSSRLYDQTLNWWMFEGEVTAALALHGGEARLLGEESFDAQGARGRGETQALRNLAYGLEEQLGPWIRRTLESPKTGFAMERLEVVLADPVALPEDYRTIAAIQAGLDALEGVRRAEIIERNDAAGRVVWKVVYDRGLVPMGVAYALFARNSELADKVAE